MNKNEYITISLFDHRFGNTSFLDTQITCSCGTELSREGFYYHQIEWLNKQLEAQNIKVEVV